MYCSTVSVLLAAFCSWPRGIANVNETISVVASTILKRIRCMGTSLVTTGLPQCTATAQCFWGAIRSAYFMPSHRPADLGRPLSWCGDSSRVLFGTGGRAGTEETEKRDPTETQTNGDP